MFTLDDPIAFSLGPFDIRWYALFIVSGIFLAVWLCTEIARRRDRDPNVLLVLAPWLVFGGIAGARLYWVALEWKRFQHDLPGALNIRSGGLSIHGAIIVGVAIILIAMRIRGEQPWAWFDLIAPGVALGQAVGRWGNWANQEAFGRPTTLPWAVTIRPENRPPGYESFATFHPTFLYESVLDALLCLGLVWLVLRGPRQSWFRDGDVLAAYLIGYGLIRFMIESLRTDSLYIGPFPAAHWLSVLLVLAGIGIAWYQRRKDTA